jgi:hypothetical protein
MVYTAVKAAPVFAAKLINIETKTIESDENL